MTGELVAFVTCPPDKAEALAVQMVESKLAACVNIVSGITSVYVWEGQLNQDGESLLIMKTSKSVYDKFEAKIKALHPYEVPEIICLPIESGSRDYLEWLNKCLV